MAPPEQHKFGAYETWDARSSGFEADTEPRIVVAVIGLLEKISSKSRRKIVQTDGPYAKKVLDDRPLAYWRLEEIEGQKAVDASGNKHDAAVEDLIAWYLEGPNSAAFNGAGRHQSRGALCRRKDEGRDRFVGRHPYSLEMWFWNGFRPTCGRSPDDYSAGQAQTARPPNV